MEQIKDTFLRDFAERLLSHLHTKVIAVLPIFGVLKTNEHRVTFAYQFLEQHWALPELLLDGKSRSESEKYRQYGNDMFKKRQAREAHEFYTKSVAFAEIDSEHLALAYANRSAVLFEKGLYEECLQDIEYALQNKYPENLKPKLLSRQFKAKGLLPIQEKVDFLTRIPTISEADRNPLIQSAANSIELKHSETFGRHVVATRDIKPGEIIAIEKPFCQILTGQLYIHCHHCLKLCYTLIPCPKCTEALFCSIECQTGAHLAYHQYECPILLTINRLCFGNTQLPLRITISARNKYEVLEQCVLDKDGVYRSDRYNEIHNLVANTSKRDVADLFMIAIIAADFYYLMKRFTKFFEGKNDKFEATFKELILHHIQTGSCNFHAVYERKSTDNLLKTPKIGCAAFSFLSMFSHSCCSNVVRYCYGPIVVAITVEAIKKGEQCFDGYGYSHEKVPKADRKAELKKNYFFDCTCPACINDYPLFESLKVIPDLGSIIPESDWQMLNRYNLEEAKKILTQTIRKIEKLQKKKPNQNLMLLQWALFECCMVFSTMKTPI